MDRSYQETILYSKPGDRVMRILVVRAGALGDLILTFPVIGALREYKNPSRNYLELLTYPSFGQLAEKRYYADRVISIDRADFAPFFELDSQLPKETTDYFASFNLIVLFSYDQDLAFRSNLQKAGVKQILYSEPFPPIGLKIHVTDYLLSSLRPLGVHKEGLKPKIFLNQEDRAFAVRFWKEHQLDGFKRPIIAIHPGSGSRKKNWSPDRFADLGDRLAVEAGATILLVSGPADSDTVAHVLSTMKICCPIMVEGLSVVQLAAVLEMCTCYVGNDSGVTHLAAAIGVPTVAIFGPTEPAIWGPRGPKVSIIKNDSLGLVDVDDVLREVISGC